MVGDAAAAALAAGRVAVLVVHIDQVDVAGDIELAGAELAHADHPQLGALSLRAERGAVPRVELRERLAAGRVEREFGQLGHGARHVGQRRGLVAIDDDQPLQHQLAQDPQGRAGVVAARAQGVVHEGHLRLPRGARRQQREFGGIPAPQARGEARMGRQRRHRR